MNATLFHLKGCLCEVPYIFSAGTDMYVRSGRSNNTNGLGLQDYSNLGPATQ